MEKIMNFDWAMKSILRDKENFVVLEGFVSTILNQKVEIVELLESESNQKFKGDKYNRVDIKARDSKGEIILIEVQTTRERNYLQRILYGTSKAITEHIRTGDSYDKVKKVYSINILYFDLGKGKDYVYHGRTKFIGVNTQDELCLTPESKSALEMNFPDDVFPEYYLVRVNVFDKLTAETPLEEWLDYLKNNTIKETTVTPGLKEAQERLRCLKMTVAEYQTYMRQMEDIMYENDVLSQAHIDGLAEGLAKGMAEGRAEGRAEGLAEGRAEGRAEGVEEGGKSRAIDIANKLKSIGLSIEQIIQTTGLTEADMVSPDSFPDTHKKE